ncbi:MAG: YdcF family protein [Limnothrix sp.]
MPISSGEFVRTQTSYRKRRSPHPRPPQRFLRRKLILITLLLSASSLAYQKIHQTLLQPEAVFVLGGHEEREKFAAELAQDNPSLDIWVSSGSPPDYAGRIFDQYGVKGDRLHLDYEAQDTVTNFTSLVDDLKQQDIDSVYLITSENHMQRAQLVAQIIFGSQGIAIKPIAVPSENPPEAKLKCVRDGLRAVFWVFTGETGAEWFPKDSATIMTSEKL